MIKRILVAMLMLPSLAPAAAQGDVCADYIGKVIQPTSIDTAILQLSKVPNIKGEFETQAQFDQRQKQALAVIPATYVIAKPLDLKYVTYDADAGAFAIGLYAFDNLNTEYGEVFGTGTPFDGKVNYDVRNNNDIVISQHEGPVGRYMGNTAGGGRAQVTLVLRTIKAIFQGMSAGPLFATEGPDLTVGTLTVPVAQARTLKATLGGAVVIRPKWPFVARGTHHWAPSFDMPEDTTQKTIAVVANIKCGLVLDGAKKVLAAFPTNYPGP